MAARQYDFETTTGDVALPVADGSFLTPNMLPEEDQGTLYLEFYNSAADARAQTNAVNPSAGTVTLEASPLGNVFLRDVGSVTVQADTVTQPSGTYTPPFVDGLAIQAKITFASIAGATHCRAVFVRRY